MTMIDEEVLASALRETADSFDVSSAAARRILDQMRADEAPVAGVTRIVREPGRARNIFMSAAALVIAIAVGVPLAVHESGSRTPVHLVVGKLAPRPSTAGTPSSQTITASGFAGSTSSEKVETSTSNSASEKIESTGTIGVKVASGHVQSAFNKLSSFVTRDDGFVDSSQAAMGSETHGSFSSGTIVLEVPQGTFKLLVAQAQEVGHTTSVVTNSNDVTSQYVDLQARIDALKVSLNQYLKIMTQATSISGILAVQNQIDQIQSQIEQDQGQLNVLNHKTTYAQLTVNVATPTHHTAPTTRTGLNKAWHDSVSGFVSGFEWLIRLAGPVIFVLLVLGALYMLGTLAWRNIRRRRI
jgi:Domain of unknown function (DUF4349)